MAGNGIPIGFQRGVQGDANPWPADFDPGLNCPINIIPLSAVANIPLPRGSYVEVTGDFSSGWEIRPNGANGGTIPLAVTACFAAPRDGQLIVSAIGSGTPILIVWPAGIGREIAKSRGFAPPGNSTASAGGTKYPSRQTGEALVTVAGGVFSVTPPANTVFSILKAGAANVADLAVTGYTGTFPVEGGAVLTTYGTDVISGTGTNGDTANVLHYRS